ncbi:DUF6207 family protein [Streptomyces prasinus]|uniref:DUF6207 family protein n=1 Tax=Streptomyces prasinus TaxID=67345 RepID=UPI0033B888F8
MRCGRWAAAASDRTTRDPGQLSVRLRCLDVRQGLSTQPSARCCSALTCRFHPAQPLLLQRDGPGHEQTAGHPQCAVRFPQQAEVPSTEDPGEALRSENLARQPGGNPGEPGEARRPAPGQGRLPPAPRPRRVARVLRPRCGLQGGLLHRGRQPRARRPGRHDAPGHRRRRNHRLRRPHRRSRPPGHGKPRQPQDPADRRPRRRR